MIIFLTASPQTFILDTYHDKFQNYFPHNIYFRYIPRQVSQLCTSPITFTLDTYHNKFQNYFPHNIYFRFISREASRLHTFPTTFTLDTYDDKFQNYFPTTFTLDTYQDKFQNYFPNNIYFRLGKSFCKTSFQLGMGLKKGQKQGRDERTQEDYPSQNATVLFICNGSVRVTWNWSLIAWNQLLAFMCLFLPLCFHFVA